MTLNIAILIILGGGWLSGKLFTKLKLPSVLGMTLLGVFISLFIKDSIPSVLWEIAPFLKSLALIVILLRAGLGIKKSVLKKVGRTALFMAFIPCIFEGTALTVFFFYLTPFDLLTSALTATLLSAVSPAVVVPSMLNLKEAGYGEKREVPTLVLAGASLDDVFAITLFTMFIGISTGESSELGLTILSIPISILGGILSGIAVGFLLSFYFKKYHDRLKGTEKALILLTISLFLFQVGEWLHIAALLGVMTAGFIVLERAEHAAHETARQLNAVWVFAEIILFVIIGSSVDVNVALEAGFIGILIILGGLVFRSIGVLVATLGSGLNLKERVFCIISYLPKATVQAALGAVALEKGLAFGNEILAFAVMAIIITAPLGLLGINLFGPKLLNKE
ncbi:MAG: cation:proton antiporter [Spirochaetaceae bacterium]